MRYNPVERNFNRIRRVLIETLAVPREAVRPSSTFASLVPHHLRRRVWQRFRKENLDIEPLTLSGGQCLTLLLAIITAPLIGYLLWSNIPFAACFCPIAAGIVVAWLVDKRANGIDETYSVGDAALAMTTIAHCQDADYRLNRNEIFLKVRRVVATAAGVDPKLITRETSFSDDLGLE